MFVLLDKVLCSRKNNNHPPTQPLDHVFEKYFSLNGNLSKIDIHLICLGTSNFDTVIELELNRLSLSFR